MPPSDVARVISASRSGLLKDDLVPPPLSLLLSRVRALPPPSLLSRALGSSPPRSRSRRRRCLVSVPCRRRRCCRVHSIFAAMSDPVKPAAAKVKVVELATDPGLIILYDVEAVHIALGQANSPVTQGAK